MLHYRGDYLYFGDASNNRVRRVRMKNSGVLIADPTARPLDTVAGSSTSTGYSGDGDLAVVAKLNFSVSAWTDASGNLVIADTNNNRLREMTIADGKINTIVGGGTGGFAGDGGSGRGVTVTATATSGNYLPAVNTVQVLQSAWAIDSYQTVQNTTTSFTYHVRTASTDRMAADTTFTPTTTGPFTLTSLTIPNNATTITGTATPTGSIGNGTIVIPAIGTTFGATQSSTITVLPSALQQLTINDSFGPVPTATGVRNNILVRLPSAAPAGGVTVNITSSDASRVRVSACNPANPTSSTCTGDTPGAGVQVTVPAGQTLAWFDLIGQTSAFTDTRVNQPFGTFVNSNGDIYFADLSNFRVRKLSGGTLSTFAGTGATSLTTIGLNQQATATAMRPIGVVGDNAGNIYISNYVWNNVMKVDSNGVITNIAGVINGGGSQDGVLGTGRLNNPYQIGIGADGSFYIADYNNARIRKVPATGPNAGQLTTIAGVGSGATAALQATFQGTTGVAVDPATDDVYIADYDGHKMYRVVQSTGAIESIAGTGTAGFNGDQTNATIAQLNHPYMLHFKGDYLYFGDASNNKVRRIRIKNNGVLISDPTARPLDTVAGSSTSTGYGGDGDLAIVANLNFPVSVWTDSSNNLIIADTNNNRVRQVTVATGKINNVIGSGTAGFAGDAGPGSPGTGLGVTITAAVANGGPNYLPVQVGTRVNQSSWTIDQVASTQTGPTFTFRVQQTSPELGSGNRLNQSTTFNLLSTNPAVLGFNAPQQLTIADNATQVIGSANTLGAGSAQIVAQASATGIDQGSTSAITVQPTISSVSNGSGYAGTTTAAVLNGQNLITATGIQAPSGIVATITAGGTTTALNISVQVQASVVAGSYQLTLLTPGGNANFTFSVLGSADKTWVGGASGDATNWSNPANWSPSGVPTNAQNVVIPQTANPPVLTATVTTNDLFVLSGASLSTGAGSFGIVAGGNLSAVGNITGSGSVSMVGASKTILGVVPNLGIVGSIALNGSLMVNGAAVVTSGSLDLNGQAMTVTSNFGTQSTGVLKMQNASGVLTVNGGMVFGGASETGFLTAGVVNIQGDFVQSTGSTTAFAASGTHKVVFNGTSNQNVSFQNPGSALSHFQNLEFANTSASGVDLLTNAVATGSVIAQNVSSKPVFGNGNTLTVSGLAANGLSLNNVLLVVTAPSTISQFDNAAFSGYASTATQFTISNAGAATPFIFNNLVFSSVPTTGFYISATDTAPGDGNVFTINLVSPTPAGQTRFSVAGGAVIHWP
jgi:hypothetical protein